jgi:hypothetical protein
MWHLRWEKREATVLTQLSPVGFQLWLKFEKESKNYFCIESTSHPMCYEVRRVGNVSAVARIVGNNKRCNCINRTSFLCQCPREITVHSGKFIKTLWSQ